MLIHLVKNAVFWLNAFTTGGEGITQQYSPSYIMTGRTLSYNKHAVLKFGSYVQTHEEHSNDMSQRTMGCICLGPAGNQQGGHWFMSLTSGERVVRYQWTTLPMPREVIERVSSMGKAQWMPTSITYADRRGHEITDWEVEQTDQTDSETESDDSTYQPIEPTNDDLDQSDDEGSESDSSDSDIDEQSTEGMDDTEGVPPAISDDDSSTTSNEGPQLPDGDDQEESQGGTENSGVDNPGLNNEPRPEFERFREAELDGEARAADPHRQRPQQIVRAKRDDDFIYAVVNSLVHQLGGEHHSYVTEQMSIKAGLKLFGKRGSDAVSSELKQLIVMNVMSGCVPSTLSKAQKAKALKYLMFLKEKGVGALKGEDVPTVRSRSSTKRKRKLVPLRSASRL